MPLSLSDRAVWHYRFWQFWQALTAVSLPEAAWTEIEKWLTPAELTLFRRFQRQDRWHSYSVLRTLQAAGHHQPNLLAAALLHDIGKTRLPLSVWERSLIVLAQWLLPQRAEKWGEGAAFGWKRPFVVKTQHPAWGAEMAAAAGSSPQLCRLIRRHQDRLPADDNSAETQLLRFLQWADDQN